MKIPGHLRIQSIQLAPGQEWEDEARAWRFLRVDRGSAYWLDAERSRALNPGEVLVAGPHGKAVVRASQLNEVGLHGFYFDPDLLCGFFTMAERGRLEQNNTGDSVHFFPSTHPLAQNFSDLATRSEAQAELALRVDVLGLAITFFAEGMLRPHASPANTISAYWRFQKIISEMPDLELINYTPEQLASLCGCSPRHFNRLFHAHFGESPRARQTELRLLKARQLLASTNARISQVALDSGYRSLSLFNALFKRRFGISPSDWREQDQRNSMEA